MVLISPEGENLLDFLELLQVLSTYDGELRDMLWWLRKGRSPCELIQGLLGFLSPRCRGVRTFVESGLELNDSSPVLTRIWGISGVSPGSSVLVSCGGMHERFPPKL